VTEPDPAEMERAQQWAAQAAAERRDTTLRAMTEHTETRIPPRFADATATDPAVLAWVQAVTAAAEPDGGVLRVRTGPSLLITGLTGTGKTFQAFGAMRALNEAGAWAAWERVTAADLYALLRPRPGVDAEREFGRIARCPVLVVDDLAAAKGSEWTEEINFRLVNDRYEHHRPTIFTTNAPQAKLPELLGVRVASRLTEMCETAVLKGTDRRRRP
jgi:DNA replication protein DnaC